VKKNGATRYPSWISRYSYHSAEQTVKNKKLDHRVITILALYIFLYKSKFPSFSDNRALLYTIQPVLKEIN
jgi:hypothetical protein